MGYKLIFAQYWRDSTQQSCPLVGLQIRIEITRIRFRTLKKPDPDPILMKKTGSDLIKKALYFSLSIYDDTFFLIKISTIILLLNIFNLLWSIDIEN